tara:strand:+ start:35 stop:685 length:651 start_codon:yes stop_codon:yes gene_type:complete
MGVESCSSDAEGFYGVFDKDFILHFLKNQNSLDELPFFSENGSPLIKLSKEVNKEISSLLYKLEEEYLNQFEDKHRMIGVLLCQILLLMKRRASFLMDKKIYSASELLTRDFIEAAKARFITHKSVTYYAELFHVTSNHLNKCVKECTGKNVSSHISDMIILEAKVMLQQTDLAVSIIAFKLNFESVNYFSRFFKKYTGITPTSYKENNIAKNEIE